MKEQTFEFIREENDCLISSSSPRLISMEMWVDFEHDANEFEITLEFLGCLVRNEDLLKVELGLELCAKLPKFHQRTFDCVS